MKYGKILDKIILNNKGYYINYNYLKSKIYSDNLIELLEDKIIQFDNFIKDSEMNETNFRNIYNNLLINYLTIRKILKKIEKKNNSQYVLFLNKYGSVYNFISRYEFFKNVKSIPKKIKYQINKICPICLDNCNFPVTTRCNHTYCWECLLKVSYEFNYCPYCRQDIIIDPNMIILNTMVPCDNKYSLIKLDNQLKIDVVSDLHIDQWSYKYTNKYPCGIVKNIPFKLENINSKYLIVAGDISDNIYYSIEYLNILSKYYHKILFVDGNHEHVHKYPELYSVDEINKLINNPNIIYLSKNTYKIKETLFIGCCGWWDYNNQNSESIKNCLDYFDNWINHFSRKDNLEFINNVINRSKQEFEYLDELLNKYENDNEIENIIIVTHTIPDIKYSENKSKSDSSDSQYNTKFKHLFKYKKLKKWIFGHTHEQWDGRINGVDILCNPRGRPEDFNRETYRIKTIHIN